MPHRSNIPQAVVQRNNGCCSYREVWAFHQVQQALKLFEEFPHVSASIPAGQCSEPGTDVADVFSSLFLASQLLVFDR